MKTSQDNVELFPYEKFGFRLEFGEKKNITVCWFECQEHLDKYLERYKLDKRTIKIDYRDGEPVKSGKKQQNSVEQRTRNTSSGGSSRSRGSTKKLDSTGTSSRTRKPKSK
jgi:hypothetical protein